MKKNADTPEHLQRALEERAAAHGREAIRSGVVADLDSLAGGEDERAGDHLANSSSKP